MNKIEGKKKALKKSSDKETKINKRSIVKIKINVMEDDQSNLSYDFKIIKDNLSNVSFSLAKMMKNKNQNIQPNVKISEKISHECLKFNEKDLDKSSKTLLRKKVYELSEIGTKNKTELFPLRFKKDFHKNFESNKKVNHKSIMLKENSYELKSKNQLSDKKFYYKSKYYFLNLRILNLLKF